MFAKLMLIPACVGLALAAAPALADSTETLTLRSGAMYQGSLVEKVPNDHVTLKLATGEVKKFAWAEIAKSSEADGQAPAVVSPAAGASPEPDETPGATPAPVRRANAKSSAAAYPAGHVASLRTAPSSGSDESASSTDTAAASPGESEGGDATVVRPVESRDHLDVQPAFLIPLGDLANGAGMGLGAMLGFEHGITGTVGFTARAGYVYGFDTQSNTDTLKATTSMSNVPILAGTKIYLSGRREGLYLAPELGLVFTISNVQASVYDATSMTSISAKGSSTNTTLGGGASAGFREEHFDFALGAMALDVGHVGSSTALFSTVAYGFDL